MEAISPHGYVSPLNVRDTFSPTVGTLAMSKRGRCRRRQRGDPALDRFRQVCAADPAKRCSNVFSQSSVSRKGGSTQRGFG